MDDFSKTLEQSNRAGVGFILTEIETGLTFLDVANTTSSAESAVRNRDNARLAYQTALRYLGRVHLECNERDQFDKRLAELKKGLEEAGFPVEMD